MVSIKPTVYLEVSSRQLSDEEPHMREEFCVCTCCDYVNQWKRTLYRLLWYGILFPGFWVVVLATALYGLTRYGYFCPSGPDSFINIARCRIPQTNGAIDTDDHQYTSHFNSRYMLVELTGYVCLGIIFYSLAIAYIYWGIIYVS